MLQSFLETFSTLDDPRVHAKKNRHTLIDILVITVCAVLSGADDWVDVAHFGNAKQRWFARFLELPNGIPSHDTFGRVFSLLDPDAFADCFLAWMEGLSSLRSGRVIAIDGKTLRRSHGVARNPLHMVSAFCTESAMVIGQVATEEKSNEITAIPRLLDFLDLDGAILTIDAMGAQTAIVNQIHDSGGDYVIGLKANQKTLYDGAKRLFSNLGDELITHDEHDSSQGRDVLRSVSVTDELDSIAGTENWRGLRSLVLIITEQIDANGRLVIEKRYYLSSLPPDANVHAKAIRSHWHIENKLHWSLDVTFREDQSRVATNHGAQNLAVARHIALNLLRKETTTKGSLKTKRKRAGWNDDYLSLVLFGE